jgi:hypothetical protein
MGHRVVDGDRHWLPKSSRQNRDQGGRDSFELRSYCALRRAAGPLHASIVKSFKHVGALRHSTHACNGSPPD